MKLSDLLTIITDDSKVVVENYAGDIYEVRDGENSINPKYNNRNVVSVSSGYYQIGIIIQ